MSGIARVRRIQQGHDTAAAWLDDVLQRAEATRALNCFTAVLAERAGTMAAAIDHDPSSFPLAGLPFAAKDLFDVAGRVTLAGSRINAADVPAAADANAIARLIRAGANLVGLTNMDEYAYGFSTENAHYGVTRNPHDPDRIAGGSSGGSATAVAAGVVPVSLGSDTNGSIRVPASLCGIYGLKPTFGRLSRAGVFPFVDSLDHVGAFARSVEDLAAVYDVLQGADGRDPACVERPVTPMAPLLDRPLEAPRIGVLEGWFRHGAGDDALAAVDRVAGASGRVHRVTLDGAPAARSAAFCMTGMEGGALHADRLRTQAMAFDPAVRDRLLAGALLPPRLSAAIERVRAMVRDEALALFRDVDLLLAPATPCAAPRIGEATIVIAGQEVTARAHLGLYTQPISFIGLPVIVVPVPLPGLPIGVQMIAPPWREDVIFRAAAQLERNGHIASRPVGNGRA